MEGIRGTAIRDEAQGTSVTMAALDADAVARGWDAVARRLRAEVGADEFGAWLGRLELDRVEDGVARFSVPTKFLRSWIGMHYAKRLTDIATDEMPGVRATTVAVRGSGRAVQTARPEAPRREAESGNNVVRGTFPAPPTGTPAVRKREPGSRRDARMTFATIVAGASNAAALEAAQAIAEGGAEERPKDNPLWISADAGVGKTHLLQAIAHALEEDGRNAVYLTAQGFMYGFLGTLRTKSSVPFRERLEGIDAILVDDVQFLQGEGVSREFADVVATMVDAGRPVVLACDVAPSGLPGLDERTRSRVAAGREVAVAPADETLKIAILEKRIAQAREATPLLEVPADVVRHLAASMEGPVRDLAAMVNRLAAAASGGTRIDVATADAALAELRAAGDLDRARIEDVQRLVAAHYGVARDDLMSERRTADVVRPRQVAMYLSKIVTSKSLPEIGRRFGGRDHTTVLHAVRKIEGLVVAGDPVAREVALLHSMLCRAAR